MKLNENHKIILETLGKQCQSIRLDKGYTQKDVANEYNIPLTEVQNFEKGRSNSAITLLWYISNMSWGNKNDNDIKKG